MIFFLSSHSPGEEIKLEKEGPPSGGTIVEVRRDTCVTLRFEMAKISRRTPAEYAGLKISRTISVKNSENTSTPKLLGLRVFVFGTTGGIKYESICDDCQKKENRPGSLFIINFRSKSYAAFPLRNSDHRSICKSFSFHCYPKHYNNNDSQYRCVIRLRYSSQIHSQSLAWRCSHVKTNHKTLLLFSIASRILSTLLRIGPETNHCPDGTLAEQLTTTMALPDLRLPVPVGCPVKIGPHLDCLVVSATFRAPHSRIAQLYPCQCPRSSVSSTTRRLIPSSRYLGASSYCRRSYGRAKRRYRRNERRPWADYRGIDIWIYGANRPDGSTPQDSARMSVVLSVLASSFVYLVLI